VRISSSRAPSMAVAMLADQAPAAAMLVAGGPDVYPNMKRQQYEPKTLIGLCQLRALHGLTAKARDGSTIGAGVTLTHVSQQQDITVETRARCLWGRSGDYESARCR